MPMPTPSRIRSPIRLTSRPTPSAELSRISANALTTAPAAARDTPKLRANSGIAGATMPKPAATKKATAASTATSRGRPRNGPLAISLACWRIGGLPALVDIGPDPPVVQLGDGLAGSGAERRQLGGGRVRPGLFDGARARDHRAHPGLVDHPAQRRGGRWQPVRQQLGELPGGVHAGVEVHPGERLAD